MRKIVKFFSYWRDYLILVLAVVISFYLLFFANELRQLGGIQTLSLEIIGRLTAPFAKFHELRDLRNVNQTLRYQNTLLQIKNAQMAEAYYENMRLRQLLGFSLGREYPLVLTKITGTSGYASVQNIIVDVGEKEGIQTNMTVVSADGLVGRIVKVSSNFSIVQTLVDPNFRAAAMVQRSRIQGVFQWAGYETGSLIGVYLSADVKVGDIVVTSGMNSMFVPGLKIGTVTQMSEVRGGLFKKIYLKPKTDFTKLEEVFIIRKPAQNPTVLK